MSLLSFHFIFIIFLDALPGVGQYVEQKVDNLT
jgi:hypothetical protein